jgi:hypothetical protein
MDDPAPLDKHGPWIIAAAIILAALLVIGFFLWRDTRSRACDRWEASLDREESFVAAVGGEEIAVIIRRRWEDKGEIYGEGGVVAWRPSGCS